MSVSNTTRYRVRQIAWALAAISVLTFFFANRNPKVLRWTESVPLSSGQQIEIKRHVKFRWRTNLGAPRSGDETISSTLQSIATPKLFPDWSAPMVPVLLDRDPQTGQWWLVATNSHCEFWQRNLEPQPPYWAFVVIGNRWRRAPIPEFASDRRANLFTLYDFKDWYWTLQRRFTVRKREQMAIPNEWEYNAIRPTIRSNCAVSNQPADKPYEQNLIEFWRP
jgi:hypothetical protein